MSFIVKLIHLVIKLIRFVVKLIRFVAVLVRIYTSPVVDGVGTVVDGNFAGVFKLNYNMSLRVRGGIAEDCLVSFSKSGSSQSGFISAW
jgi:hypothetical protein